MQNSETFLNIFAPIEKALDFLIIGICILVLQNISLGNFAGNIFAKSKTVVFFSIIASIFFLVSVFTSSEIYSYSELPQSFRAYRDQSFNDSSSPQKSPFGGNALMFTEITASFHSEWHILNLGHDHFALDIIPTGNYYQNSESYKLFKQAVIFSTCNGLAESYIDNLGAVSVKVNCNDNLHKTYFIHLKKVFIPFHQLRKIKSGEVIGVMGKSGNTTGEHVHYAIEEFRNDKWEYVDPLKFFVN